MPPDSASLPAEVTYSSNASPTTVPSSSGSNEESAVQKDKNQDEKDLLTRYNELLDTNPVITKSLTSAFISAVGTVLGSYLSNQQQIRKNTIQKKVQKSQFTNVQRNKSTINWLDVFAFALHGGIIGGPLGHYWFDWLSKQNFSTVKSTLLDQLLVQPPLLIFMFLFIDSTKAAVKEIPQSMSRTSSTVGPTIVNSWKFWPFAVWCTFRYLKKKHYTVALNLCSLAWTMYLNTGEK